MSRNAGPTARGAAAVFLLVLGLFCGEPGNSKWAKVFLPSGKAILVELAVSDEERALGLMFRESLPPGHGMLFIFEEDGQHSFWMKNCRIALDLIWLDGDGRIMHVEENAPPCPEEPCPSYMNRLPARYVLELRAGAFRQNGLKLYDRLSVILPPEFRRRLPPVRFP